MGLALAASLAVGCGGDRNDIPPPAAIGGPFSLVDADGRAVTERDLLGRPTAVFFGFTFCPEVCPTTLAEMSAALKSLGPDADRLNVVFVSVDPERDTPEQLKLYLSMFDPRIRGLTGERAAVDQAIAAYRIYARRVPLEGGGYTMDHSSSVMLFDAQGRFVEHVGYGEPQSVMVERLKALLRRS